MNKFIIIISFFILSTSCLHKKNKPLNYTTIQFLDTCYDLGNCTEGDTLDFYVKYRNMGKHPLKLHFTQGSCNCSYPILNEDPLNPGQMDSTHVFFYSNGKNGKYRETIIFSANTNPVLSQIFFNINVQKK